MNKLSIYNKMNWTWKGKQTPLKDLHENQLNHIKTFVKQYKGNHYGYSSNGWIDAIDCIISNRRSDNLQELHNIVSARRLKDVDKYIDKLFIKCKLTVNA